MKKCSKNNLRVWLLALLLVSNIYIVLSQTINNTDDYDIVLNRIAEREISLVNLNRNDNDVTAKKSLLLDDGSFSDINYSKRDQTNWPAAQHLLRIKNFALAYLMPQSKHYMNTDILNSINNGLQFWLNRKPTSTNWWYNEIDTGQKLGIVLVLMKSGGIPFKGNILSDATTYMAQSCGDPIKYNGANKIDLAIHWLYRGIVTEDENVTNKAAKEIFEPSKLTTLDDGIQHDYSYAAHYHQLYIGGYGNVYVSATIDNAEILNGTRWSMQNDKIEVLHAFLTKTYFPVIRGKYMLYNVLGRSTTRVNTGRLEASGILKYITTLKTIDTKNASDYDNAIKRISAAQSPDYMLSPLHTHFWRTDYTLHQREKYTIDTRLVSTRIPRNEELNGENLKGYFLSDGGMAITVDGGEYSDIFPAWDWSKIPGTTTPAYPFESIPSQKWTSYGRTPFAGGVSDGYYGASGYIYNDTYSSINTSARKGWFYFDDEVVCLGAGINSTNQYNIATTVNQCILDNNLFISTGGQVSTIEDKTPVSTNPDWVLHGKVGYIFPQGANISISRETRTGNWKSINSANPDRVTSKDIFGLWINHGTKPQNDAYAYIIVPNKTTPAELNSYDKKNIHILANTPQVQAVKHAGLNLWQFIFFEATTFTSETLTITVDKPCAIMLKDVDTKEITAYVADPTQLADQINLNLSTPLLGEKISQVKLSTFTSDKTKSGISNKVIINSETERPNKGEVKISSVAIADTYVQSGTAANTNYGAGDRLVIKCNFTREAYLKFDLKELISKIPADKEIEKAELRLYVRNGNSSSGDYPLLISKTSSDWDETLMTWNNRVMPEDEILDQQYGSSIANSSILFNISEAVINSVSKNDSFISFNIRQNEADPQGKHDITFHSKEYSNKEYYPCLILTLKDATPPINTDLSTIAIADTYVQSGTAANTNYGASDRLVIKSNFTREAYLKFDIEGIITQIPAGKKISNVNLVLSVRSANASAGEYPLQVRQVSSDWIETSLTWNNKVIPDTQIQDQQYPVGSLINFNITESIENAVKQNKNIVSFHIQQEGFDPQGKHDITFHSRENKDENLRPMLILTLENISHPNLLKRSNESKLNTDNLIVFPNPVRQGNTLNVKNVSDNAKYTVMNMMGQVVSTGIGSNIDTYTFSPGLYLLKVEDRNNISVIRLIVK